MYSIPSEWDYLINPVKSCPLYDHLLSVLLKSEAFQLIQSENAWLYKYLSKHSGAKINSIASAAELYETLLIEGVFNDLEYVQQNV